MKTAKMEQLSVIHLFGEQAFQLKRLQMEKNENFHEWQDLEKAVYYQTARKLIESELENFDRESDQEAFRMLLRNRYETFLAQSHVEPRPEYRLHALLQLSSIADHEEGEGEGRKYVQEAMKWVSKVAVEDQDTIGDLLSDALDESPQAMIVMFLKTIGTWKDSAMLSLAFKTLEVMAEKDMVEAIEFRSTVEATVNYLRSAGQGEYVLRFTNRLVQVVKACQLKVESKAYYWKLAYDAANESREPYTKMLMAVLLGDHMRNQENWEGMQVYMRAIDEVTAAYGEETTFGSNYQQIKEAVNKMREAVTEYGWDESLE
jgi:hypothetical protein